MRGYLPNKYEAEDLREAVEEAGGRCSVEETKFGWRVGILSLADVDLFLRAARALGYRGSIGYSAGCGWQWEQPA
ncbi:MAG TPA: hypothetical protein VI039_12735 [Solirubrobacterales bacterium]